MNNYFKDKVALVTGSAEGIGKGVAIELLKNGCKAVSIIDFNETLGKETANFLQSSYKNQKVKFILCDITKKEQLENAFKETKNSFGHIDILCNVAGVMDDINWERMIKINFSAIVASTYLGLQYMGTKNGGRGGVIINTASHAGVAPFPVSPIYGGTKHAVIGFFLSSAKEPKMVENNIRINVVCPNATDTNMMKSCLLTIPYPDIMVEKISHIPVMGVEEAAKDYIKVIEDENINGSIYLLEAEGSMFYNDK